MNKKLDLSLYLVTNRKEVDFEKFYKIIDQAILGGVTAVQLREKETSLDEMILIGKRLQPLLNSRNIPLIINDNIIAAYAIRADGVHLGQSDEGVNVARTLLGSKAIIGLSIETLNQAAYANSLPVDYVAASPVFYTSSKNDCGEAWGLAGLKELCDLSSHPVIGIGGINEFNIDEVMKCGVSGVAVLSAIQNADCVQTTTRKLKTRIDNYE